ncbi:hypothetical protein [Streptomyces canus]|nr:hypothetical protein [Streptomyces canus]
MHDSSKDQRAAGFLLGLIDADAPPYGYGGASARRHQARTHAGSPRPS